MISIKACSKIAFVVMGCAINIVMADTFIDNFSNANYNNSDGSEDWSGQSWIESGDNGNVSSGDILITNNQLRLKDDNNSITRLVDLSAYIGGSGSLSFDYSESSFDNNNDYVDIEIRTGGGTWQLLGTLQGSGVNSGSVNYSIDSYIAADTEIRFSTSTSNSMGNNDILDVDNVTINVSATAASIEFLDNFSSVNYSNSDGTDDWSTQSWVESGDNNNVSSGDILITANQLRLKDDNNSITRLLDLSSYIGSTGTLSFDYSETGFDNNNDYVEVEVRSGGGTWQLLGTLQGSGVNNGSVTYAIDSYIAADTEIRFSTSTSNSMGNSDILDIDNVAIDLSGGGSTSNCVDIFPGGLQTNDGGELKFETNAKIINNPTGEVFTTNLTIDTPTAPSCDTIECFASGSDAVQGNYTGGYPGGSDITINSNTVLAAGDYGKLTVEGGFTLTLSGGDYTFNDTVEFKEDAVVIVTVGANAALWSEKAINILKGGAVNTAGGADQLLIFSEEDIVIDSDSGSGETTVINALVYTEKDLTIGKQATSLGALSGQKITLKERAEITYDLDSVKDNPFSTFCASTPTPDPILEYRFDETTWNGSATEVQDQSTNSYDGRAENGAVTDNTNPAIIGDPGTCGYGEFDGNNDYVELPSSFPNLTGNFTITAWIYAEDIDNDQRILADDRFDTGGYAFSLGDGGAGKLRFFSRAVSPVSIDTQNAVISTGSWYFVSAVHDVTAKTRQIYVNGVAQTLDNGSTISTYTGTWGSDAGTVGIGGEVNGSPEATPNWAYDGRIDEVRVYDSALSQSEILTAYDEKHACSATVSESFMLSTRRNASLAGLSFIDEDVVSYNGPADSAALYTTPSPSVGKTDLNAMHVLNNGNVIYSFNGADVTDNGNLLTKSDLLEYNPSTGGISYYLLGDYFDRPRDGSGGSLRDIDALYIEDTDNIIISTQTDAIINGTSFQKDDLVRYTLSTNTAVVVFDGASLITGSGDITGFYIKNDGNYLLNFGSGGLTIGGYAVSNENDVIQYDPNTNVATLFFDGTKIIDVGDGGTDIDGLHILGVTGGVDHYAITHGGVGVTCQSIDVTFTGHDASHNTFAPGGGESIDLATSTSLGDWEGVSLGSGTLSNATVNDGAGNYVFDNSLETEVTLAFTHRSIGVVNFNLTSSPSEDGSEDPNLTMSDSGFIFDPVPLQISGKDSDINPNGTTLSVQAVRTSDNDFTVCNSLFADGSTVVVELAAECINPSSCGGSSLSVKNNSVTSPIATEDDNGAAGAVSYSSIGLLFGVDSKAELVLNYDDAGEMLLNARYNLPLQDGTPSGVYMLGASNQFVVRPFGFDIDVDGDGNLADVNFTADRKTNGISGLSYADDTGDSAYARAGEGFNVRIRAVQWQAGDDSNNDGIPDTGADLSDNTITSNFGNESAGVAANLAAALAGPFVGSDGALVTGGAFNNFVNGQQTQAVAWTEVGILELTANLNGGDYLSTGENIVGVLDNIGRFTAHHFLLQNPNINPADTSVTDYSYMGQEFTVDYDLLAVNAFGATTLNYDNGFDKLDIADSGVFGGTNDVVYGAVDGTTMLSEDSLLTVGVTPAATWIDGVAMVMAQPLTIERNVSATPDGPYSNVEIGVNVLDSDGIGFESLDLDLDVDSIAGFDVVKIAGSPGEIRYGRTYFAPVFGPEIPTTETTDIPFEIQYWDGSSFVINTDDNTTDYYAWTELLCDVTEAGPDSLLCTDVTVDIPEDNTSAAIVVSGEEDTSNPIVISRPGKSGSLDVTIGIDDWLKYDWFIDTLFEGVDDDALAVNPVVRITFGTYRGHDKIIYWRENHNP